VQKLTYNKASALGSSDPNPNPELDLCQKVPDMGDTDSKFLSNTYIYNGNLTLAVGPLLSGQKNV
jgi:hypothetical protein